MRRAIGLCSVILLISVASASLLVESGTHKLIETRCTTDTPGLKCFKFEGTLYSGIIFSMPLISIQLPERVAVQEDTLSNGFSFVAPLTISGGLALEETSVKGRHVLRVTSFDVQLRQATCLTECPRVSVSSEWTSGGVPLVRFHCSSRSACLRILWTLRCSGAEGDRLRASLQFRFFGQAIGKQFTLNRTGLPAIGVLSDNFGTNAFWFEPDRILLFSIAANSGFEAAATFLNSGIQHPVSSSGVIPTVFRSGLIDRMSQLFDLTGMRYIVAEMRARGRMVAQVVLDISVRTAQLNKESWFARDRVVSSHPYPVGDAGANPATRYGNYFSVVGDDRTPAGIAAKRSFLISYEYGGCPNDIVFWYVSDIRDSCQYGNRNWGGLAPSLVYTTIRARVEVTEGAGRYDADQFLVYLM